MINTYSDYENIASFDAKGPNDYYNRKTYAEFEEAYATVEQDAGQSLTSNLQDRSLRDAFRRAGWDASRDPQKQATEWFLVDFEYAQAPVSVPFTRVTKSMEVLSSELPLLFIVLTTRNVFTSIAMMMMITTSQLR